MKQSTPYRFENFKLTAQQYWNLLDCFCELARAGDAKAIARLGGFGPPPKPRNNVPPCQET